MRMSQQDLSLGLVDITVLALTSISHSTAAGVSIPPVVRGILSRVKEHDRAGGLVFGLFGVSLISSLLCSALFHMHELFPPYRQTDKTHIFRHLDEFSIYILSAGAATPLLVFGISRVKTMGVVAVMGGGVVAMITFRMSPGVIGHMEPLPSCFIFSGLMFLLVALRYRKLPWTVNVLASLGCAAIVMGLGFFDGSSEPARHLVWHFFVIVGLTFVFLAVEVSIRRNTQLKQEKNRL